jgi:hypothetical protein
LNDKSNDSFALSERRNPVGAVDRDLGSGLLMKRIITTSPSLAMSAIPPGLGNLPNDSVIHPRPWRRWTHQNPSKVECIAAEGRTPCSRFSCVRTTTGASTSTT